MNHELRDMELLVVGPYGRKTGGIQQYMARQLSNLDGRVETASYDIGPPAGSGVGRFVLAVVLALRDAVAFPFSCDRPDVVHIHTGHYRSFYRAAYYVLFASLIWRTPVVLHVHGSSFDEFVRTTSPHARLIQTLTYRQCDRIVTLSAYWQEILQTRAADDKVVVVPNAVDVTEFEPEYEQSPPHLTLISHLIERKGVSELLSSIERLEANGESAFRLSIAGDGPQRDRVEQFADGRPNVEYLGFIDEMEKTSLLSRSSVFVLPSYAEGMPLSILEAMAGGNTIVSTTVGSIPEVIDEDSGVLVEPGDVDALYGAIADLVESPERTAQMGRRNRRLSVEEYDWRVVREQLLDLYAGVV